MNTINLTPNEWVTKDVLMLVTGFKPGKVRAFRENVWRQGREYTLISPNGDPKKNSEALYHLPSINNWIKDQAKKQPVN